MPVWGGVAAHSPLGSSGQASATAFLPPRPCVPRPATGTQPGQVDQGAVVMCVKRTQMQGKAFVSAAAQRDACLEAMVGASRWLSCERAVIREGPELGVHPVGVQPTRLPSLRGSV